MASSEQAAFLEEEIAEFFTKTSVSRAACDALVAELFPDGDGDDPAPSPTQGGCSYTVFAGPGHGSVVQFRLKSLALGTEMAELARKVYGEFAPQTVFKQQLGSDDEEEEGGEDAGGEGGNESKENKKEPLLVYVMSRVEGIPHIEFILAHGFPRNSPENSARRDTLVRDLARFFALSWKSPQPTCQTTLAALHQTYTTELTLLQSALPARFHPTIATVQASLPRILALPLVLAHNDINQFNVLVSAPSGSLVGMVDWAEASVAPFGENLHALQHFISEIHLRDGWTRYDDYDSLVKTFWDTLAHEAGEGFEEHVPAIKLARVLGLLRTGGFTCRLANMPEPQPVKDDESGRYKLMILDGLLINPATRFEDVL